MRRESKTSGSIASIWQLPVIDTHYNWRQFFILFVSFSIPFLFFQQYLSQVLVVLYKDLKLLCLIHLKRCNIWIGRFKGYNSHGELMSQSEWDHITQGLRDSCLFWWWHNGNQSASWRCCEDKWISICTL